MKVFLVMEVLEEGCIIDDVYAIYSTREAAQNAIDEGHFHKANVYVDEWDVVDN